jgi:EAL domain-containing protein (putative c-di-GMP-specific phosphodiesterase class I)
LSGQEWKRKEYETWDGAFQGLAPAVRQQSVRVAAYTQALYLQACAMGYGHKTAGGQEEIRGQYGDLAYKCGLYHQLGKALVPPEYQQWQQDYTQEELAVYRKYTTDGRVLVSKLQEKGQRARERQQGQWSETPTKNIPWLMLRESCEQHMERWNGSGYPGGRKGEDISPIAHIVGLAKELDRLASETPSETPFQEACDRLIAGAGTYWSPELIRVLEGAREKCQEVYQKYIHYTMTLPTTIHLVERRKDRPMGLHYRPMIHQAGGETVAYEAIPWFGGLQDGAGETESICDIEPLLTRTQMVVDASLYLMYEATDTLVRIQNCHLDREGILLQMMPGFYSQGSQLKRINQVFQDQQIQRDRLMLTISQETVQSANKGTRDTIEKYLRNGILLVLDGYNPDSLPLDTLKEMGFTHLRLSPKLYQKPGMEDRLEEMRNQGMTVYGGGADRDDILRWLEACQVSCISGTVTGTLVDEDELIRDALAVQNAAKE